ncbi:MAG: ABC transporter ATP-binding protein [Candidatus Eiseniibacteriota bacterium]
MAKVVFDGVGKTYPGGVVAVRDATFTVEHGEFMVVVGPSGCGKSTTLRMVAGLEDVTEGQISIDGRVVNEVAPKDRDIAMVFQNYALYPHMSVYDNMAFGLKMRKVPKPEIDARVREAADILGLGDLLQRKPKALSGGQRQRVAVGRAIVRHPKVFLFDEPLANLDAKLRVQTRAEISRLHQRLGATMIYVTHDQVEAMTMGTRITLMKDGVIQQIDEPLRLYREPANRFVAGFIGSPSMNLFEGTLVRDGAGCRLQSGALSIELGRLDGADAFPESVTMGVRPENLSFAADGETAGVIAIRVELVEPLGSEIYLHGRAGDHSLVARIGPDHPVRAGDTVRLALDLRRLHFFDGGSGAALRPVLASVAR